MLFNIGDIVRIGKGKVEYSVADNEVSQVGEIWITSQNTGKGQWINPDRLTLVTAARNAVHATEDAINAAIDAGAQHVEEHFAAMDEIDAVAVTLDIDDVILAPWEIELLFDRDPKRPFLLTVDHVTTGHKSFDAAANALVIAKRNGFNFAVIDHDGQRKVTRIAA